MRSLLFFRATAVKVGVRVYIIIMGFEIEPYRSSDWKPQTNKGKCRCRCRSHCPCPCHFHGAHVISCVYFCAKYLIMMPSSSDLARARFVFSPHKAPPSASGPGGDQRRSSQGSSGGGGKSREAKAPSASAAAAAAVASDILSADPSTLEVWYSSGWNK